MAAAVSSPWGKPGAWALDAEEHEAELQQQQQQQQQQDTSCDFPSLAAAAATKPSKKKNKGQTLSLAEFVNASAKPAQPDRLTPEEMLALPTGPRQRSADELDNRSRLGGGFKNYGSGGNRYGEDSRGSRASDEAGGRRGGGFNRESAPSRADEIDNWTAAKKPVGSGFERRERGGFFENSQSKADEVDSWVANKSSVEPPVRRFGGGGSNGGRFEKRGSFDSLSRNKEPSFGSNGASDSDTWGRKKEESSGGGSVGVRPRLVLQPRTLPVVAVEKPKGDSPVAVEKPKGVNPFGNARPREEVLAEKGKDWKEIDEKLEAVKIKEVMVEKGEGSFGKRGFGLGNGREDDKIEKSWRKSAEKAEDGQVEERKEPVEETKEHGEEQN